MSSPFWGELHTHSDRSDGNGRPEDCFAIARSHLDFWALADHAFDDEVFYVAPDSESMRRRGADWRRLNVDPDAWPEIQELCRSHEAPGEFIPFLAYEWTNFQYGHHNVYYLDYDQPIRIPPTLPELYESLRGVEALVIPHHTGYAPGACGKNWDYHDESRSPFVEIYSVHGSSEEPGGIRPLLTGGSWMGPGCDGGSVQEGLARGLKLGIIASSDAHGDHPGAYDLGLVAAYAEELTRASLWRALKAKRIYGTTGDRIALDFSIDGHPMGSTIRHAGPRHIELNVTAWDQIDRIDILKNNKLLHCVVEPGGSEGRALRWAGEAGRESARGSGGAQRPPERLRFQLEWGWDRRQPNDWTIHLNTPTGRILQAIPCYRNRVETRVGRGITHHTESSCTWTSHTIQVGGAAPSRRFADAIWLEIECPLDAPLHFTLSTQTHQQSITLTPQDIISRSTLVYMDPFPATNNGNHWAKMETLAKCHILQGHLTDHLTVCLQWEDTAPINPGHTGFYYARVTQKNGHRAWSSPIWVEA